MLFRSPKVYEATSEQRKYLHIAAVFACNFANHMYALSARILEKHHIPFEVMLSLIDETAKKVHGGEAEQKNVYPHLQFVDH